ncbi:MAG: patatin-like phospholipase family protein, partial [Oligoflexales bacterium]|nr:patatin-like phospholipase family protein [Oligoflexales bacterium]
MKTRCMCFDGGGIRGILLSTILPRLQEEYRDMCGKSLSVEADILAGTSIGAYMA